MFSSLTTPPTTLFKHHNTPFLQVCHCINTTILASYNIVEIRFPRADTFPFWYFMFNSFPILPFMGATFHKFGNNVRGNYHTWWNTIYIQSSALQTGNAVGHRDTKWRHRDAGPRIGEVGTQSVRAQKPNFRRLEQLLPCVGPSGSLLAVRA